MKAVIILCLVGVFIALAINVANNYEGNSDDGRYVAFVCGKLGDDWIELQGAVSYGMTILDPPRFDPKAGRTIPWSQWIREHFELRTESGELVKLKRSEFADVMPKGKVGTPDFYIAGRVKANTNYTFDYLPLGIDDSKRYRCTFLVAEDGRPFERANFEYVPE